MENDGIKNTLIFLSENLKQDSAGSHELENEEHGSKVPSSSPLPIPRLWSARNAPGNLDGLLTFLSRVLTPPLKEASNSDHCDFCMSHCGVSLWQQKQKKQGKSSCGGLRTELKPSSGCPLSGGKIQCSPSGSSRNAEGWEGTGICFSPAAGPEQGSQMSEHGHLQSCFPSES